MSRPTFICVPGFCHTSAIFDPLRDLLGSYGYAVHPVTLPSIVTNGTPTSNDPAQDMRAIRSTVSRYVEAGHYVIVVLHSYAGVPGGDALQGLSHTERAQRGLRGGVLRVVYVVGWIVKEGFKMCQEGDYSSFPPYLQSNTTSRVSTISVSSLPLRQPLLSSPVISSLSHLHFLLPQSSKIFYIEL
jgi:hypothetical protein